MLVCIVHQNKTVSSKKYLPSWYCSLHQSASAELTNVFEGKSFSKTFSKCHDITSKIKTKLLELLYFRTWIWPTPSNIIVFRDADCYRHADNWVYVEVRSFAPYFRHYYQKLAAFKRRIMCIVSEKYLRLLFDHLTDTDRACKCTSDVLPIQCLWATQSRLVYPFHHRWGGVLPSVPCIMCCVIYSLP